MADPGSISSTAYSLPGVILEHSWYGPKATTGKKFPCFVIRRENTVVRAYGQHVPDLHSSPCTTQIFMYHGGAVLEDLNTLRIAQVSPKLHGPSSTASSGPFVGLLVQSAKNRWGGGW